MDIIDSRIQKAFDWLALANGENFLVSEEHCQTRDIFHARLDHMRLVMRLVSELESIYQLVTAIVGEIGNNAFDHNLGNWKDEKGVYFVYDVVQRFVVVADRGQGVLASLKRVRPELTSENDAIKVAFTEIVSGRAPESRGNGLKLVESIVRQYGLKVTFYSNDGMLIVNNGLHEGSDKKLLHGVLAILEF